MMESLPKLVFSVLFVLDFVKKIVEMISILLNKDS